MCKNERTREELFNGVWRLYDRANAKTDLYVTVEAHEQFFNWIHFLEFNPAVYGFVLIESAGKVSVKYAFPVTYTIDSYHDINEAYSSLNAAYSAILAMYDEYIKWPMQKEIRTFSALGFADVDEDEFKVFVPLHGFV